MPKGPGAMPQNKLQTRNFPYNSGNLGCQGIQFIGANGVRVGFIGDQGSAEFEEA